MMSDMDRGHLKAKGDIVSGKEPYTEEELARIVRLKVYSSDWAAGYRAYVAECGATRAKEAARPRRSVYDVVNAAYDSGAAYRVNGSAKEGIVVDLSDEIGRIVAFAVAEAAEEAKRSAEELREAYGALHASYTRLRGSVGELGVRVSSIVEQHKDLAPSN